MRSRPVFPVHIFPSLVLLASILVGCKDGGTEPKPTPVGTVIARIDGVSFLGADELFANHVNGVLGIATRSRDSRTIHLTIRNAFQPETIDVGPGSQSSAITGIGQNIWRSNVPGGSGRIIITRLDALSAEGSFSFKGAAVPDTPTRGARTVTGTFNVTYELAHGMNFFTVPSYLY